MTTQTADQARTTTPNRFDWSSTEHQMLVVLLAIVVVATDMPETLPFWPSTFGHGPSVGAILLITALIVAIARLGQADRRAKTQGATVQ
jgi:hypothetical protein